MRPTQIVIVLSAIILAIVVTLSCRDRSPSYIADIKAGMPSGGLPQASGKLYLNSSHVRLDWGLFADVFDLKDRTGWRILSDTKTYQELCSKDLSTSVPEMTGGSLCPHAQLPSECKLVGAENVGGRTVKKWDLYNPKGFHVYYWIDEKLGITMRMAFADDTTYQVTNLRQDFISDSLFELPSGYKKVERQFNPCR
jgi:hypothetical protein